MKLTNKPIKRLSLYIFLIFLAFQTPSQADDIRDFQIEGMSIGDSLLDYFDVSEIKKSEENSFVFKKKKFMIIFSPLESDIFDDVQITYKIDDKKYIIHGLEGKINFINNYSDCIKKKKEIEKELKIIFKDSEFKNYKKKHGYDRSGKSTTTSTDFIIKSGGFSDIYCTDWSEEMEYENEYTDDLTISLGSEEFRIFMMTAYK